ncbi:MAG: M20 family metallopeptidase [Pseudomonadota bacterium]
MLRRDTDRGRPSRCGRLYGLLSLTALALGGCASEPPTIDELHATAMQSLTAVEPTLVAFRHDLHRYPELAGAEVRTAGKVTESLTKLGFDVRTGVGGHGVVATLVGDPDGPLIAFRADMDAVAGDALDPVPYASEVDGAHHICGHDIHTTIGVGIAHGLASIGDALPGRVMLVFQPSEEAGIGAELMLEDAVFGDTKPDAIFTVHAAPFPVGQMAVLPDGMMAGRMLVDVRVSGEGDLGSAVNEIREALMQADTVGMEQIFAFQTEPFISINLFGQADDSDGNAAVRGFVMSAGLDYRPYVEQQIRSALDDLSLDGLQMQYSFKQALEGVNNDAATLSRANAAIAALAPSVSVSPVPGVIPAFSEDFGSFQRSVPGVMYMLGIDNPQAGTVGFPHSPDFVADDGAIRVGVDAMIAVILDAMRR